MIDKLKIIFLTLTLIMICMASEDDVVIYYGNWLYLIHLLGFTLIFYNKEKNYLFYLSPTYLTLAYLNLSYFMGQYVIARGIGYQPKYHNIFFNYESVKFVTIFFLLCNLMVFLALDIKKFKRIEYNFTKQSKINYKFIAVLLALLLLFTFIEVDLTFIGGGNDHSYAFQLTTCIFIVNILSNTRSKIKYPIYLLMILISIIGNFEDKRQIFFILILIIFFEFIRKKYEINFSFKKILFSLALILLFTYIILVSSLLRGYGQYNVDNPVDATFFIGKYLNSNNIKNTLTANFELSSAYGNTSNAVDYVYKGEVDYLYGYTFIKFLFIPIPRQVFPGKPRSMIDIYTTKFAPHFRDRGGSLPVGLYGESIWNFSLLSLIFIYLLYSYLNKLYRYAVLSVTKSIFKNIEVFIIYLYITLIMFIRGSGFEIWLVYPLISIPLIISLNYYNRKFNKSQ